MLKQLSIKNYALIKESTIAFPKGFTVITGETGAGKSILLGALGLVLGNRAETDALYDKTKKCIVEGVFDISEYQLNAFFTENDIDFEKETSIRREISSEGKSRAFINDTPVNLSVLKSLSEKLIDVHSQHETLLINQSSFQFKIVDSFANTKTELVQFHEAFVEYTKNKKQLNELKEKETQLKKELDYIQFQFKELDELSPVDEELAQLETDSETLENAESIKANLHVIFEALNGDNESAVTKINSLKSIASQLTKYGDKYEELNKRINAAIAELKDIAEESADLNDKVIFDPEKLGIVNDRIDAYNKQLKKHGANSEAELLKLKEEFEEKINTIENFDEEVARLEKQLNTSLKKTTDLAKAISKKRKEALPNIEKGIKEMLEQLSMPNAIFKIELNEKTELDTNGLNTLKFIFSGNKGNDFKELHKVASGGELSRLMLCIKAMVAKLTSLPAIIFDEIDTGVSGDVADKIGIILKAMGTDMQVISITHLPQIASKGDNHLFVYKDDSSDKTISKIKTISAEERVNEIAKMLSSGKPGEAALNNARELLYSK
jgi:DNA repair protein RecN (Recombination protein N)